MVGLIAGAQQNRHPSQDRGRCTHHASIGYSISQRCRKRIEEVFGWIKSSAGLAKVKLRGRDRVDAAFTLALAAYNLKVVTIFHLLRADWPLLQQPASWVISKLSRCSPIDIAKSS